MLSHILLLAYYLWVQEMNENMLPNWTVLFHLSFVPVDSCVHSCALVHSTVQYTLEKFITLIKLVKYTIMRRFLKPTDSTFCVSVLSSQLQVIIVNQRR